MPPCSPFIFLILSSISLPLPCTILIFIHMISSDFMNRTVIVLLKFIFNTSLIVQFVRDGSWVINLFYRRDGQVTHYPADSFQLLYLFGFYKIDDQHEHPFMSSIIWDLLFILLLNYCKNKLRVRMKILLHILNHSHSTWIRNLLMILFWRRARIKLNVMWKKKKRSRL